MAFPIYDYSKEAGLGAIVGTPVFDVQGEIDKTLADIAGGHLNKADTATAKKYLEMLRGQAGTKTDGGAGYVDAAMNQYFETLGVNKSDDAGAGSGVDYTKPYFGTPKILGKTDPQAAQDAIHKRNQREAENGSIWNKYQALVGNIGLILIGGGVMIAAIYFTAKKV